jgi:hypothetical protein
MPRGISPDPQSWSCTGWTAAIDGMPVFAGAAARGASQSCQAIAAEAAQPSLGGSESDAGMIGCAGEGDASLQMPGLSHMSKGSLQT